MINIRFQNNHHHLTIIKIIINTFAQPEKIANLYITYRYEGVLKLIIEKPYENLIPIKYICVQWSFFFFLCIVYIFVFCYIK